MELSKDLAIEWWMDHLNGDLSNDQLKQLHEFLVDHDDLKKELESTQELWSDLSKIHTPEPSEVMDEQFYAMLAEKSQQKRETVSGKLLLSWFQVNWQVGLASLSLGLTLGFFLFSEKDQSEVARLSVEISEMKKMMVLSLIEEPRAQQRIQAVNMVEEVGSVDSKITEALISTLNTDKSINVRLAALEALVKYSSIPEVRKALVNSISTQQSPLVQSAMADAMILIQANEAAEQFQKLVDENPVDASIKSKLESTIETLKEI